MQQYCLLFCDLSFQHYPFLLSLHSSLRSQHCFLQQERRNGMRRKSHPIKGKNRETSCVSCAGRGSRSTAPGRSPLAPLLPLLTTSTHRRRRPFTTLLLLRPRGDGGHFTKNSEKTADSPQIFWRSSSAGPSAPPRCTDA